MHRASNDSWQPGERLADREQAGRLEDDDVLATLDAAAAPGVPAGGPMTNSATSRGPRAPRAGAPHAATR
jgi:hypothetical protein